MTKLSAGEQLILEDINSSRLDPNGEAAKFGIDLNEGVPGGRQISADPKQVLAPSDKLSGAAEGHSGVLNSRGEFFDNVNGNEPNPHTGLGDGTPESRIAGAGFADTRQGGFIQSENLAWAWATGQVNEEQMLHQRHDDLFKDTFSGDRGHRTAMMQDDIREIGLGVVESDAGGKHTMAVTENFGRSGDTVFETGVVYNDKNGDGHYGLGEGVANVKVTVDGKSSDTTGSGGGWSVGGTGGAHEVTFSEGGLAGPVSVRIDGGANNAKADLVNGNDIHTAANAELGQGAQQLHLIGTANVNGTGNAGDNVIVGNKGANHLDGGLGNDTLTGGAGADIFGVSSKTGHDTVTDFAHGQDKMDLTHIDGVKGIADLKITQGAGGAEIDLGGGDHLTLSGVQAASLDVNDFLFGDGGAGKQPEPVPMPQPAPVPPVGAEAPAPGMDPLPPTGTVDPVPGKDPLPPTGTVDPAPGKDPLPPTGAEDSMPGDQSPLPPTGSEDSMPGDQSPLSPTGTAEPAPSTYPVPTGAEDSMPGDQSAPLPIAAKTDDVPDLFGHLPAGAMPEMPEAKEMMSALQQLFGEGGLGEHGGLHDFMTSVEHLFEGIAKLEQAGKHAEPMPMPEAVPAETHTVVDPVGPAMEDAGFDMAATHTADHLPPQHANIDQHH